jgi:hypothetical protein
MRLVSVDRSSFALELVRERETRMARRDKHVDVRAPAVELEPVLDRADLADAAGAEALVPARGLPDFRDVLEELVDRRVVAVEEGEDERPGVPLAECRANGEPGEGRRRHMAVALRAHTALPDGGRTAAPLEGRIRVRSEHGDFGRREPPMAEGCIGDQPGEPAADDCAPFRHCYLTEPASRPCTK